MTTVETGRRTRRPKGVPREEYCQSCSARMRYGEPNPHATWPQKLTLDQNGVNVLLVAAAEFLELHYHFVERAKRYGLPIPPMPTAVEFVDWVAPALLPRDPHTVEADFDGIRGDGDWMPQASDGTRRTRGRAA